VEPLGVIVAAVARTTLTGVVVDVVEHPEAFVTVKEYVPEVVAV
jgi:hypothetical protein